MNSNSYFDAIVIGAGHAGTEASLAVARSGFRVLLLTMNTDSICQMSCNPAVGGIAKGHMVREIDALGGQMALAIDETGIQFRMLNKSKGPAVWAPRAQADKKQYQTFMKQVVESEANIDLRQDQAVRLIVENGEAVGVVTQSGESYYGKTIVVTTGTFMRGLIHVGSVNFPGGRGGDPPSIGFSDSLREHGIEMIRFKTGTPPRLRRSSVDFSICEEQKGDERPEPFSYRRTAPVANHISCYLTYTNEKTHDVIRKNLHRSPLYGGIIKGTGPRYCPSIEDKVVKFSDKERHQIYLEPEGLNTDEIYVNGISTSLPHDVQLQLVRTIKGLENAELVRFGYAIEYDCAPPIQLKHSLETKAVGNLFFAGQINCTSGYEEAAAQGLMAGLNVVRKLRKEEPFILNRSEAYIGVLIDDLVTRGTNEPYRMFTSRAEFRLLLRQDNADERLMKYGHDFGLIPGGVYEEMLGRQEKKERAVERMKSRRIGAISIEQWIKRPENTIDQSLIGLLDIADYDEDTIKQIEIDVKYDGYIQRQLSDVEKFKKLEKRLIPEQIDYGHIFGMSREATEKLAKVKPRSLGQASRISGISPCDMSILSIYIEKFRISNGN